MPYGLTSAEKRAWRTLVAALATTREVEAADVPLLEAAAVAWARAREARELVNRYGVFVPARGSDGVTANPALRLEREAWKTFERFAVDLGLTAAARRKSRPYQLRIPT